MGLIFGFLFPGASATEIAGQLVGIVAIILGFISYQTKTKRGLLIAQSATAAVFCLHYGLLGAFSGMAVNAVNIVRNTVYELTSKNEKAQRWVPIAVVIIQCTICCFMWEAWYSVFVLLGQGISSYCMSFKNPQNVRKSILVTCPLVLVYDAFASSIGGIIYESVAIVSAIIGIIRNKKPARGAK